jgi:hypothetical protein
MRACEFKFHVLYFSIFLFDKSKIKRKGDNKARGRAMLKTSAIKTCNKDETMSNLQRESEVRPS